MSKHKNILHITYDYSTTVTPDKTASIRNLVELTADKYNNVVINLNRINMPGKDTLLKKGNVFAINTFGLSKGIFFRYTIVRAIKNIKILKKEYDLDFRQFDLVHAHKLCFEGPIAFYIHSNFNIPFIISIRTHDFPVLKYRIDLRNFYKRILKKAEKIFIISPWMEESFLKIFGQRFYQNIIKGKLCCLGSIVDVEPNVKSLQIRKSQKKLVTIFKMRKRYLKIKNVKRLFKALKMLNDEGEMVALDVIGDGEVTYKVKKLIKKYRLDGKVNLLGYVDNARLNDYLYKYDGFVMPSFPETFGLAYIEALRNGLPIVYSRGAGVDGFFTEEIGVKVNPFSIDSICNGMRKIIHFHSQYKKNVVNFIRKGGLQRFSKNYVIEKYCDIIDELV